MRRCGLRSLGAVADGEVGDIHPLRAIGDVPAREDFDEIIISTLPQGISRWLKMDLPDRVARRFDLPVTHVVGPAGDRATQPRAERSARPASPASVTGVSS